MMPIRWFSHVLYTQPFLALFLTIAIGYAIGKIKIRGVALGTTAVTLVVGLLLSVLASSGFGITLKIDPFVQTLFFNFFMFAVGLRVGPQFFAGIERDGWRFVGVTLVVALLAPILALGIGALFGLSMAAVAGTLAGGMTASAALGAAQSVVASKEMAADQLSASFAMTYILSMFSFVLLVRLLPRLFRRDPVASARQLESALKGEGSLPGAVPGTDQAFVTGYTPLAHRAFRLTNPELAGMTLAQLRESAPLASIERVRRHGEWVPVDETLHFQIGDEVSVIGRIEGMIRATGEEVGPEIADPELRDFKVETAEVVVTKPAAAGKTLHELGEKLGAGLYLAAWFRGGEALPVTLEGDVKRGDVLRLTGSATRLRIAEQAIGTAVRYNLSTDILTLAIGLTLGTALGLLTLKLGTVRLALGTAVGLMLAGVAVGTLRARNPLLGGPVPDPARALLEDLGLAVFIGTLALSAGPGVVKAMGGATLLPILLCGLMVALIPAIAGYAVGLRWLRLNPSVLLGAICGARCNTAGLKVAQEEAHSAVPAIGFAVPTAVGTVLVTIAAYLMVSL